MWAGSPVPTASGRPSSSTDVTTQVTLAARNSRLSSFCHSPGAE